MSDKKNDHIINVPNPLKEKAGEDNGKSPMIAIKEAQLFMTNNDIDFKPMARRHLKEIETYFEKLKETKDDDEKNEFLNKIIENIMQIKAHGGMFHYQIMSDIANVVLHFLDNDIDFNQDLYQIIEAHNNSIRIIIKRDIKGDGGIPGKAIIDELTMVTKRYHKKYSKKKT